MLSFVNTVLKIADVSGVAAIVTRAVLVSGREKLARAILAAPPEKRKRIMDLERTAVTLLGLARWLVPAMTLALPLAVYLFIPEINPWVAWAAVIEVLVMVWLEYYYRRWLVRYVSEHEQG